MSSVDASIDVQAKDPAYTLLQTIPATDQEGQAVADNGYSYPRNDCGETIDKAKEALDDYRKMTGPDFRKKYGLP